MFSIIVKDATVAPPPPPPPLVISSLSVSDTANAGAWSQRTNLQVGDVQYGDRTFTFTAVPGLVAGSQWIRGANNSKSYAASPLLTFSINKSADVYVALDNRSSVPSWLTSWTNTGLTMVNNEATPISYNLYVKNFAAGTVSLGGGAGKSQYTVIVK